MRQPLGDNDFERLQNEVGRARDAARERVFDSLRNFGQGNLYPTEFDKRSPAYQRSWLESQIAQREAAIAKVDANPKEAVISWAAIFGSVLGGMSLSVIHEQLTELKARLADLQSTPAEPQGDPPLSREEQRRQNEAGCKAEIAHLERELAEIMNDPTLSEPKRRRRQIIYEAAIREAEEELSRWIRR